MIVVVASWPLVTDLAGNDSRIIAIHGGDIGRLLRVVSARECVYQRVEDVEGALVE